jgi:uncharacterized protein (DUF1810 family)
VAVTDGLDRFLRAQDDGGTFEQALAELQAGAKRSHWMWFIFPQIAGLGRSDTARYFAVADVDEAAAFLAHPVLGPRLRTCTEAMLAWAGRRGAVAILGPVDAQKFASSMTLFERVDPAPSSRFGEALDLFHEGARDPLTLALIGS